MGRHRRARPIAPNLTRGRLEASRLIRPFAHRLGNESVWRFTRESVARGMALGLFAGFIVPIGQILLAALAAIPLRANLAVASVATLVTNPVTFPPIYYAAYRVGLWIIGDPQPVATDSLLWTEELMVWAASATLQTFVGLLLFAFAGSVLGYAGVRLGWRHWISWQWSRRGERRRS